MAVSIKKIRNGIKIDFDESEGKKDTIIIKIIPFL